MMVGVGDFVHAKHHLTESVMSNVGGSSDARCAVSRVQPMAPDMPVMTKIDWKSSMQVRTPVCLHDLADITATCMPALPRYTAFK